MRVAGGLESNCLWRKERSETVSRTVMLCGEVYLFLWGNGGSLSGDHDCSNLVAVDGHMVWVEVWIDNG